MSYIISKPNKTTIFYIIFIVIELIILVTFKLTIMKVEVPSGSMLPTLNIDDRLLCVKVKNISDLNRGDIVVFDSEELGFLLIKRVIGFPGETIELREGAVFIDGFKLDEPYVEFNSNLSGTYLVPSNSLFFLGDNRLQSNDARYWSNTFIPFDKVKSKAIFRYYPSGRMGKVGE